VKTVVAALLLLVGLSGNVHAQAATLPAELELALLLKVMSFDRTLDRRASLVIVVVYQTEVPASVMKRDAWLKAARAYADLNIGDTRVDVTAIPYDDKARLLEALREVEASVVMLTQLRAVDSVKLAEAIRSIGVRTACDDPALARRATSIGLILRDSRPHIIINLPLARKEGSDFSAQLLRHAEVIR